MARKHTPLQLSVIVPAYNEEKTIRNILAQLIKQPAVSQVVVVDDASKDGTVKAAASVKNKKITIVRHEHNKGKGAAIRTGLKTATGEYILIQDADLEYDPREIPKLLEPIKSGRAKVVFGSRFSGAHTNMFYWHYLGNKFLNFVVNVLYDTILSDMETCYKLVPRKLMLELDLRSDDFRIEPEIACKLLKRNIQILEVPISYIGRGYEEGKKITWVDGIKALGIIIQLRFFSSLKLPTLFEPIFQELRIWKVRSHIPKGKAHVDLGCDYPAVLIDRIHDEMKSCIGLDIAVKKRSYSNVKIFPQDFVKKINLPSKSADVITMLAVLEHLKHPEEIVRECYRILRKDGVLLVTVPAPASRPLLELFATLGVVREEMIEQHENYFTKPRLMKMGKSTGFSKVEVQMFEFGFNTFFKAVK